MRQKQAFTLTNEERQRAHDLRMKRWEGRAAGEPVTRGIEADPAPVFVGVDMAQDDVYAAAVPVASHTESCYAHYQRIKRQRGRRRLSRQMREELAEGTVLVLGGAALVYAGIFLINGLLFDIWCLPGVCL